MKLSYQLLWLTAVCGVIYRAYSHPFIGDVGLEGPQLINFYVVAGGVALNCGAFLSIFYGAIFTKQKKFILPYVIIWLLLMVASFYLLREESIDTFSTTLYCKLALLYANAIVFHFLPFHVFKKKKKKAVRAFDERTRA